MKVQLNKIVKASAGLFVVVGLVRKNVGGEKKLFNSAAIIREGVLLGFKDKTLVPAYDIFNEKRYFDEGKEQKVFVSFQSEYKVTCCYPI